jgi:GNAT superfamily N-acetyltransferase
VTDHRAEGRTARLRIGTTQTDSPHPEEIMADAYRIEYTDSPDDADYTVVGFGIRDFNVQHAGPSEHQHLCLFLHAPDDQVVGGLIGATFYGWLLIELLWVREDLRGQGHGRRLLAQAEQEARRRGAKGAFLDTFSFQAPEFYRRNGYEVFGELHDFPGGYTRFYLKKKL